MAVVEKVDLENAKVDTDDLGDILNSDSSTTVTTRLEQTVKSVAKAIGEISAYDDKGAWLTSTAYVIKDLVQTGGTTYICTVSHTSGVFATDKDAGKWGVFQTQLPEKLLSSYVSFSAAIAAIGSDEETLALDVDGTITGDITIPTTLSIRPLNGRVIDGAFKLTHNGPLVGAGAFQWLGSAITAEGFGRVDVIRPQWFGALGNGTADDTSAIQAAMDVFATSDRRGGTVYFSHGLYRVDGSLSPKSENIHLVSDGKRNPQAALSESDIDVPATLYKTGTGPLIKIDTQYRCNGFCTHGITLLGAEVDKANITGIQWFINGASFRRDFIFEETTVTRFQDAFEVHRVSGAAEGAVGVIRILLCSIVRNTYIFRHSGTSSQVNGFVFEKNDAGNNGYTTGGGIYGLRAQNITIADNILEGQRDALYITGAYRSIRIQNNYFEANVGDFCIHLNQCQAGMVGPNMYNSITSDYKVKLTKCIGISVLDPAWQHGSILCNNRQNDTNQFPGSEMEITAPSGVVTRWLQVDKANDAKMTFRDGFISSTDHGSESRSQWIDGRPILVGYSGLVSGDLITKTFALTASAGDFLSVSYPFKLEDPTDGIYVGMRVNGSGDAGKGSWDGPFEGSNRSPTGEWLVLTVACQALEPVTSLEVYFWPFGTTHTGTKGIQFGQGVGFACTDPSEIKPFVDVDRLGKTGAPPTAGSWLRGDKLWDWTPSALTTPGWVCTTSGTPGTWVSMAALT